MSFGSSWLPGIENTGMPSGSRLRAEPLVARAAFVLHDVAGRDDRVHGPARVALRTLEHREERRVGGHAAHSTVGRGMQMRIGDLQYP